MWRLPVSSWLIVISHSLTILLMRATLWSEHARARTHVRTKKGDFVIIFILIASTYQTSDLLMNPRRLGQQSDSDCSPTHLSLTSLHLSPACRLLSWSHFLLIHKSLTLSPPIILPYCNVLHFLLVFVSHSFFFSLILSFCAFYQHLVSRACSLLFFFFHFFQLVFLFQSFAPPHFSSRSVSHVLLIFLYLFHPFLFSHYILIPFSTRISLSHIFPHSFYHLSFCCLFVSSFALSSFTVFQSLSFSCPFFLSFFLSVCLFSYLITF